MAQKVFFGCESVYQLLNAITLRLSECRNDNCDLVLSDTTKWQEDLLQNLYAANLFDHIYRPGVHDIDAVFWDMELEEKRAAVQNPKLYFQNAIDLTWDYDRLFFPIDHIFWKMVYYSHVNAGKAVEINMYDEGVRAYTMDLPNSDTGKQYLVGLYPEHEFISAVKKYYLHQPDLYNVNDYEYELCKIPMYGPYFEEIKQTLLGIYGCEPLPSEPYIYLEDFFFADSFVTNDFTLFEQVANFVGKENITTKRHPRDKWDRFSERGYKTVGNAVVPWEIQLLGNDLTGKVLISVSSTSILTPFLIFDSDIHVISLENMFVGLNPTHKDQGYRGFMQKMRGFANRNEIHIHCPNSMEELEETIRYLKLKEKMRGI